MSPSDAVTLVAAAFGAFFGAWLAFLLEERRRKRVEADRRYYCLLQAQLALGMQREKLLNIQRGYLDLHREEPDRHMRLEPLFMSMDDLRVDFPPLVFVAEAFGFGIVQTLYLAEQGYITATSALAKSNGMIEKRLAGGPLDSEAGGAVAVFDSSAEASLKGFIDDLYCSVDGAIDSMGAAIDELTSVTRKLYPERKAHHFELPAEDSGRCR